MVIIVCVNIVVIRVIEVKYQIKKYSPGWVGGWVGGRMDGWMDGRKSRFKDCLQQSKTMNGDYYRISSYTLNSSLSEHISIHLYINFASFCFASF